MSNLQKTEAKLKAQLDKLEVQRKALRKKLQVTRIRIAAGARKDRNKASGAVAKLLAKKDPTLYAKLLKELNAPGAAPRRTRRRKKAA